MGAEGAYIARTDNESSLSIEQVCAALKERGGFAGNFDALIDYVRQFFREAAYQVCDGYNVNMDYFSVYPHVGGTFNSASEIHDHEKHPVTFRFRAQSKLRKLAGNIEVVVAGLAGADGFIDDFTDVETGAINESVTAGGMFAVRGHKIKVAGDAPGVGVFFVSSADPSQTVAVSKNLAENTPSKVIGVIPALPDGVPSWRVAVKTQYTGGGTFLKEPRIIKSGFKLTRL